MCINAHFLLGFLVHHLLIALNFSQDLKLGHYMKIPPRLMFFAQIFATVIAGTTQLGVQVDLFQILDEIYDISINDSV